MIKSNKILELRKGKKMKRDHLAVELGVSPYSIWVIEHKPSHNPCVSLLLKYSKYFDIPLKHLVSLEDIELRNDIQ